LIAGGLLVATGTFLEVGAGLPFGAGIVGMIAYICLIPALLGVARLLREPAPRLSVVGGLLATIGCVGAVTFQTAILHEWAARMAGTPEATLLAINEVVEGRLFPVLVLFSILFPISLIVLGVGLFQTGVVPKWVPTLLGFGALIFPVGHIGSIQLIMHLADLLLLVPLAWIGLRLLAGATPQGIAVPAAA
jgi:hypothetical protein